jgi:hypothetical protein
VTTNPLPRYLADPQGYHRDYYHKRRQAIYDHLGGKCVRCGATERLQVDHIDRAQKTMEISDNMSLKRGDVLAELAKCQLLCKPCHERKTGDEMTGFTHGTTTGWMRYKCPCSPCQEHKAAWRETRNALRRKPGGYGPRKKTDE